MNNIIKIDLTNKIYNIRGMQVMLDMDLAKLYQVETRVINQAVKRNPDKFPDDLMFTLNDEEFKNLRSQNVIFKQSLNNRRYLPKVFTEQGVYMLATVLKSKVATDVTLAIMRTFTKMKHFVQNNSLINDRFERIEQRLSTHNKEIEKLFKAIEDKSIKSTQGIFFDGQIFDAYEFVATLIKNANKDIALIDNYIDESVLTLFSKNQDIDITIYTKNITKQLKLDLEKYNAQYRPITLKQFKESHDRFMIIDENEVYHFGASLKDLGKKWFAFSKFDRDALDMLGRLR